MAPDLIVQKYGGSSLCSPSRLREIARRIAERAGGKRIIVTVSAMGQSTDDLVQLAYQITPNPQQRELDMLLSVGERISMALLAMALNAIGCDAISFTGSQSGIVTTVSHTRAFIEEIRGERIREALADGKVVIVAGFQGVSRSKEITTLGRGGSDTTAVALAATLGASSCEIYSDFPGVFTADPRVVEGARVIPEIEYDEMLELAALGARVLHYRAAEIARRYRVPLHLRSTAGDPAGTRVCDKTKMEKAEATSITCNENIALLRLTDGLDSKTVSDLFDRMAAEDVQVISYHKDTHDNTTSLTLVVDKDDVGKLTLITTGLSTEKRDDLASVSIVGTGFACNAGAIARLERRLAEAEIPVYFVGTSSLSVTCIIPGAACKRAVEVLHSSFFGND